MTTSGPNGWTGGGVALRDEVGAGDGDGDGNGEPTVGEATPEARGEEEGSVPVGAGWQLARTMTMARPSPTAGARRLGPRTSGKTRLPLTGYDLDCQRGQCKRRWRRGLRWGRDVAGGDEKAGAHRVDARRDAQGWHLDGKRSDRAPIHLTDKALEYRRSLVGVLVPNDPAGVVERRDIDFPVGISTDGPPSKDRKGYVFRLTLDDPRCCLERKVADSWQTGTCGARTPEST